MIRRKLLSERRPAKQVRFTELPMPITIREFIEPLSRASLAEDNLVSANSSAGLFLIEELSRYCRGLINGRSFLISGHRGAGKTTLVASALWKIRQKADIPGSGLLRPLLVQMNGTTLLPGTTGTPRSPSAWEPWGSEATVKPEDSRLSSEAEEAKKQITLTLYRALASEVAREFRRRAAVPGLRRLQLDSEIAALMPEVVKKNADPELVKGARADPQLVREARADQRIAPTILIEKKSRLRRELLEAVFWSRRGKVAIPELVDIVSEVVEEFYRRLSHKRGLSFRRLMIAAAKELARDFQRRVQKANQVNSRQAELAAELEAELPECPDAARLRRFWQLTGLLDATNERTLFRPAPWHGLDKPGGGLGQSFRELLALSAAAEAYLRVSGEVKRADQRKEEADERQEAATGLQLTGKDLLNLLVVLMAGGLAGAGAAATDAGAVPATLVGFAAALAASVFFKVTRSRSQNRSRARDYSVTWDLTAGTLDRLLPSLIDRVLEAGLAPIFVVDELDKVRDLRERIGPLVGHFKKFVAEQAFFCFLTDRDYFESVSQRRDGSPYPPEYTYFTHRLYVTFSVRDLHAYLEKVLVKPESPRGTSPASQLVVANAEQEEKEKIFSEEQADYSLLPYYLLFKSKMHMIDLHRELALLRSQSGLVTLPRGRVRSQPPYRLAVLAQIIVEIVIDRSEIADRIEQAPAFLRLVYDAVYYPARMWETSLGLDLEKEGREAFKQYLLGRTGWESQRENEGDPFNLEEFEMLFDCAGRAARLLSDWRSFRTAIEDFKSKESSSHMESFTQEMLNQLEEQMPGPPLRRLGKGLTFRWRYDPLGPATVSQKAASSIPPTVAIERIADADFIMDLEDFLADLSGVSPTDPTPVARIDLTTLSSQLRILSTSPAWPEVAQAIGRLRQAYNEKQPHSGVAQDVALVHEFATMLKRGRNGDLLALALVWGARVGRASKLTRPGERLLLGLRVIAAAHRFAEKGETEVLAILEQLRFQVPEGIQLPPEPPPGFTAVKSEGGWSSWAKWIKARISEAEESLQHAFTEEILNGWSTVAWDAWQSRLRSFFGKRPLTASPDLRELFCAAAGIGPSQLLNFKLEEMTLAAWSKALLTALSKDLKTPEWLAQFALSALGFRKSTDFAALMREFALREDSDQLRFLVDVEIPPVSTLILRQLEGSMTEGWLPSSTCAALSISTSEASDTALGPMACRLSRTLGPTWLVAEAPIDQALASNLKAPSTQGPIPLVLPRRDGTTTAPKSLDELASMLRGLS